jgi:membrane-bound lytic murein transglycosylase A
MQSIRAWLGKHPAEAQEVLWTNRSFIFFREVETADPGSGPTGAAGVFLTPGRSIAVDRRLHTFHTPVWIETEVREGARHTALRRLMIAQDTGSAIIGPARADIFFGSGDEAGAFAGAMQAKGQFFILVPRGVTPGVTG